MNFEKIKKKYPKASRKWWDYYTTNVLRDDLSFVLFEQEFKYIKLESLSGWLFKFFDEQGIYISIDVWNLLEKAEIRWNIDTQSGYGEIGKAKTRQNAEQTTFTKAFEILEYKN